MLHRKQFICTLTIVVASLNAVRGASFRHILSSHSSPRVPGDLSRLTNNETQNFEARPESLRSGFLTKSYKAELELRESADGLHDASGLTSSHFARPARVASPAMTSDGVSEAEIPELTFSEYEEQRPIDFDLNYRTHVVFVPGEKSVLDLPSING